MGRTNPGRMRGRSIRGHRLDEAMASCARLAGDRLYVIGVIQVCAWRERTTGLAYDLRSSRLAKTCEKKGSIDRAAHAALLGGCRAVGKQFGGSNQRLVGGPACPRLDDSTEERRSLLNLRRPGGENKVRLDLAHRKDRGVFGSAPPERRLVLVLVRRAVGADLTIRFSIRVCFGRFD